MYKSILLISAIGIIATLVVIPQTSAFGNGLFTCRNGTLAPGEPLMEKLKKCNEPDQYKDKDPRCIAVCTTEAVGGLKDGVPNKDLFINLIKTEFPEAEQTSSLERAEKCFQDRTFDKDDKTCASIAEFSACGTKLVIETKC